jgi:hypothetical protein
MATATAVVVVLNTPTSRIFALREAIENTEAIARTVVPITVARPATEYRAMGFFLGESKRTSDRVNRGARGAGISNDDNAIRAFAASRTAITPTAAV